MTARRLAKMKTTESAKAPALPDPTAGERQAIERAKVSLAERPRRVRIGQQQSSGSVLSISQPHSDGHGWGDHLTDTFGTASQTFAEQSLVRLATITKERGASLPTQAQTNGALAIMGAIAPRDELEALIGEQIIAAHMASLDFMARARANAGEYRDSAAAYANMATKASRAMATHIETLAKLRSGGKQQVIVKHVYVQGNAIVGDNGQAVFGGVATQGGGGATAKLNQPHAQLHAMRGDDTLGLALPFTGDPGEETVPDAWRE